MTCVRFACCLLMAACNAAPTPGPTVAAETERTRPSPQASAQPTPESESIAGLRMRRLGGERAQSAVVLLHGYGANRDDLVRLGHRYASETRLVLCLQAPLSAREEVGQGYMWWPLEGWRARRATEDLSAEIPEGFVHASDLVIGVLDALEAEGIGRERVVVAGFSQGAMLATDVGLAEPDLAGVGVLSGAYLGRDRWRPRMANAPPMFLSHGRSDRVLDFRGSVRLSDELEQAGADVVFYAFSGGHELQPALAAFDEFVELVLPPTP